MTIRCLVLAACMILTSCASYHLRDYYPNSCYKRFYDKFCGPCNIRFICCPPPCDNPHACVDNYCCEDTDF